MNHYVQLFSIMFISNSVLRASIVQTLELRISAVAAYRAAVRRDRPQFSHHGTLLDRPPARLPAAAAAAAAAAADDDDDDDDAAAAAAAAGTATSNYLQIFTTALRAIIVNSISK